MNFMAMLLFLALLFSLPMASVGAQSTTKLYINPSKVEYWTPALNQTFTVNVTIANVSSLTGYDFTIYWNQTLLDLVYVEIQPFLNPPCRVVNNSGGPGWYRLNFTSTGEPKSGSGPLVALSFKAMYDPVWPENATSILNLADTYLYSQTGLIPHDVYDGEYSCYSTPPLGLIIMTDKSSYEIVETIQIYGNLTLGLSPVQDGLVALEVVNPDNEFIIFRTLHTGVPPASQIVEIVAVTPCDEWGAPKNSFGIGSTAHFNVTVKNNGNETQTVRITVNIYDVNLKTLGLDLDILPVAAGRTIWTIQSIPIPITASAGGAKAYANAFKELPRNGGIAFCPEKSAAFTISGSRSAETETPRSNSNPEGTYNLTFKLSSGQTGNYTAYVNSEYTIHEKTQKVTNRLTFSVTGLKYDFNGNGEVDISDLRRVAKAYGSAAVDDPETPWDETQYWDPIVDVAPEGGDGKIDIFDIRIVAKHYGEHI